MCPGSAHRETEGDEWNLEFVLAVKQGAGIRGI
jgi:hypothetical protein